MSKNLLKITNQALVSTLLVVTILNVGSAQVRSSNNYQIQSDSINLGGGLSTSTSYQIESTVGEIATGRSTSTSYNLYAGYQQMQGAFISLAVSADVVMSPNLPGITGGTSNGSTTLTVTTDSPSGYQITVAAVTNPSMQSPSASIADYSPGAEPDFAFSTGAGDAHFGFSPEGVDIADAYKDDGAQCNTGSLDTSLACWDGLSTTDTQIAVGSGANTPAGATTTLNFRVGIGGSAAVETGVYTATTTISALTL